VAELDRAGRDAMDLFFTRQVDPILRSSRNGTRFSAQGFFIDLAEGKSETKSPVGEMQSQKATNELPPTS
jgi:hypothetical protein